MKIYTDKIGYYAVTKSNEYIRAEDINEEEYEDKYKGKILCPRPECRRPIKWTRDHIRQGIKVRKYFSHLKNEPCVGGAESSIHLNIKIELKIRLDEHIKKNLPFHAKIFSESKNCINVYDVLDGVDEVRIEERLKDIDPNFEDLKPDLLLLKNNKPVRALEIWVHHKIEDEKQTYYTKHLECIEFYINAVGNQEYSDRHFEQIFEPLYPKKRYNKSSASHVDKCAWKCTEMCNQGQTLCMDIAEIERIPCFLEEKDGYRYLDFTKCTDGKTKRCSLCNRFLLQNETQICRDCNRPDEIEPTCVTTTISETTPIRDKTPENRKSKQLSTEEEKIIQKIRNSSNPTNIENLMHFGFSPKIIEFYKNYGALNFYPPQLEAIEKGLLFNKNILAAIPTASGKTLLAEFAMLKSIASGGKALYIVPLRALASEKYERFREFAPLGVKVGISTGDFDSRDEWLGINDIIVATSEKTDSLLRNETSWMEEITTVVADEIHLLDSADRGPTLEVTLAKLMRLNPDAQIIGLSATIGNAYEIADWLGAQLVLSDWRPTELREGVFLDGTINFRDTQKPIKKVTNDDAVNLVLNTIKEGGQCLVFESSRRNCVGFARRASSTISKLLGENEHAELGEIADEVLDTGETETAAVLANCIKGGAAFHHAGLNASHRRLVEDGFRQNKIKIISSTPTLAAGLNLPARRVIVRNYKRYDPNFGMQPIPVLEYKQMAGRAGRPRLDPYGESVLLARSYDEFTSLLEHYIDADPEDIWSKLGTENALRTHVLSIIVNGFATTGNGVVDFLGATFFAHQQEPWSLRGVIDECLTFLKGNEMIVEKDGLHPTKLGTIVSRLYIDPLSGALIVRGLKKSDIITDLTLLHLVASTPDMRLLYMRSSDYEWVNDFVMSHSEEFFEIPSQFKATDYEWFLGEVKTALLMLDWINEVSADDITRRFNVGEGDIHAFADTAKWLMHATSNLANLTGTQGSDKARELEKRIHYGAGAELMELLGLEGVGRVRARRLYNAGFKSLTDLQHTDAAKISEIVGPKIAEKILKQLGANNRNVAEKLSMEPATLDSLMDEGQKTFNYFEK